MLAVRAFVHMFELRQQIVEGRIGQLTSVQAADSIEVVEAHVLGGTLCTQEPLEFALLKP